MSAQFDFITEDERRAGYVELTCLFPELAYSEIDMALHAIEYVETRNNELITAPPRQTITQSGERYLVYSEAFIFGRNLIVKPGKLAELREVLLNDERSIAALNKGWANAETRRIKQEEDRRAEEASQQFNRRSEADLIDSGYKLVSEALMKIPKYFPKIMSSGDVREDEIVMLRAMGWLDKYLWGRSRTHCLTEDGESLFVEYAPVGYRPCYLIKPGKLEEVINLASESKQFLNEFSSHVVSRKYRKRNSESEAVEVLPWAISSVALEKEDESKPPTDPDYNSGLSTLVGVGSYIGFGLLLAYLSEANKDLALTLFALAILGPIAYLAFRWIFNEVGKD
ncbi:hypothetical protein FHR99_002452 [Litorivivens lipolytica]|uniref:Uncharacterized protein n=1 Tax=Litorivivens lipolytica TaxID=1524264 RepID=A0A7W4W6X3_9GAMM|nr:hypothetical protein [Litorivivens lipolytica]MBB3048178.1 hypothetical protein [Litorivivens lipolytica]